ncbi:MAG: enoyl-CoA hydratase/isomerase family protein [Alphaproteobacteria bacterium]|nr:enoyl-CoA hydratase/isomerase family protein [Alphaproteobacteria bacterium]|tara:strand:- start:620 stop:1393 length:774 start_codon:yes stop_codon:yes gene_type:complete
MSDPVITCDINDHIALVTMNNPPVNAQSPAFHDGMKEVFDRISDLPDVRVAVLTGEGKVFSAGADIKSRAGRVREPGEQWAHSRRGRETFHSIVECKKPVIGALNGPALGAGLAVAASCDILVASESASLGLPEINVGLLGGGRHAMRLFGHSLTRRMMLTGYRVPAAELYRLGVVEVCVPLDELMDAAMGFAREIASKSPIATVLAKHALNTIEDMSLRDGYRFEQNMTAELGKYEDSKEAMLAFAEKRPPNFKGL